MKKLKIYLHSNIFKLILNDTVGYVLYIVDLHSNIFKLIPSVAYL